MRRYVLPGLVLCAAVALLALLAFGVADQGANTSLDSALAHGRRPAAPDATLALPVLGSATQKQSLASYRGKVVVLNVFASWCDPCKAEAPVLERAQRMLAAHNGTVLGVTYLDNSSDSAAFVRKQHVNYPVIRDIKGNLVRSFGSTGVPETFVIDRQGHIAAIRRFQLDNTWLAETLPKIVSGQS
jgi:cytochrome c biogenesis protein CcmG, thiol:disulfide interchange protein DsbE